jgi:hypothetical protein
MTVIKSFAGKKAFIHNELVPGFRLIPNTLYFLLIMLIERQMAMIVANLKLVAPNQ